MGDEKLKVSWDELSREPTPAPDASEPARPTEKRSGKSIITWDELSRKQMPAPNAGRSTPMGFGARPAGNWRRKSLVIAAAVGGWLIVVVAVTLVLFGGSRDRRNIEAVLRTDRSISASLKSEPESGDLAGMVERMSAIDLSGCPADFQQAYQRYIEVWSNAVEIVQDLENLRRRQLADQCRHRLYRGHDRKLGGDFWEIFFEFHHSEELQERLGQLKAEIENSYREVLHIAQRYRVDTTPYLGNGKE